MLLRPNKLHLSAAVHRSNLSYHQPFVKELFLSSSHLIICDTWIAYIWSKNTFPSLVVYLSNAIANLDRCVPVLWIWFEQTLLNLYFKKWCIHSSVTLASQRIHCTDSTLKVSWITHLWYWFLSCICAHYILFPDWQYMPDKVK